MKVEAVTKWIKLDHIGTSLYSVLANGQFRETTAGREMWKSLITGSSMQLYCNKEGFNNICSGAIRARIGFFGNDIDSCFGCDSFVGFGTNWDMTVGNEASYGTDNGNVHIPAIGYILVS